jgi:hypothetical protein
MCSWKYLGPIMWISYSGDSQQQWCRAPQSSFSLKGATLSIIRERSCVKFWAIKGSGLLWTLHIDTNSRTLKRSQSKTVLQKFFKKKRRRWYVELSMSNTGWCGLWDQVGSRRICPDDLVNTIFTIDVFTQS